MSDFNFILPSSAAQDVKELQCARCGYKFYWFKSVVANGDITVGLDKPKCSRCHNTEVIDIHA